MAIELRYGHNEQLRRLAQEIVVTQQQEIAVMQRALGDKPAASPTKPAAVSSPPTTSDETMGMSGNAAHH